MSLKIVFLVTATFLLAVEGGPYCISQQYTNGCSILGGGSFHFHYKKEFTQACNKHDVCYICGQKYGWLRSTCDKEFKKNMEDRCRALQPGCFNKTLGADFHQTYHIAWEIFKLKFIRDKFTKCMQTAKIYHLLVNYVRRKYYQSRQSPKWCDHRCAFSQGKPLKTFKKKPKT